MGVFNNFPYANFHELNADWIIEQIRKVMDEWEEYRTDMNLWKLGVDNQLAAFQAWFDNLDVQDEVRTVINELIQSGEFIEIAGPQIVSATEAWLAAHITPTTPAVDDTLSISGAAADAKVTGDRISDLKEDIEDIITTNILYRRSEVVVSGSEQYVYKNILTITNIDTHGYTVSVGDIENATATYPVMIRQYDNNDTVIKTTNLTANNSVYIKPETGTVRMTFLLYPATGTALTNSAIYKDVLIYTGSVVSIILNDNVEISKVNDNESDIDRINKSLINSDNIAYYSLKEIVNGDNNESGNNIYIYRNVFEQNVTAGDYIGASIDSVTGATAAHYATISFLDSNNSVVESKYLGGTAPLTNVFVTPNNSVKMRLRLYPSTSGVVNATYNRIMVWNGASLKIVLNNYVETYKEAYKDIPQYYFVDNYMKDKVDFITTEIENAASNGDSFIFITDEHWNLNAGNSPALIRYLKNNVNINKLFNGGDTADKGSFDFMSALRDNFNHEICSIVGNHDFMGWRSENYIAYLFDDYSKNHLHGVNGKNYYYFDNNRQKLRYVILEAFRPLEQSEGQYESHLGYDNEQINWLENTALNVTAGWGIVILTHVLYSINASTDVISPVNNDLINVLDNYNGNGEIICVIQGHTHRDRMTRTPNGIPVIITTCDKYVPYTEGGVPDINTTRTAGTITEQAFDVFIINRNNEIITAVRIGAPALNGTDNTPGSQVEYRQISFRA